MIGLALMAIGYNTARFIRARRDTEKTIGRPPLRSSGFRIAWVALALGAERDGFCLLNCAIRRYPCGIYWPGLGWTHGFNVFGQYRRSARRNR